MWLFRSWGEGYAGRCKRGEAGQGLKNEVGLAGEPEACVLEVREHRFGRLDAFVGQFVRVVWRGGLIEATAGAVVLMGGASVCWDAQRQCAVQRVRRTKAR